MASITRRPFLPSATYAKMLPLVAPSLTSWASLMAPPALKVWSRRGFSGDLMSTMARPSAPAATVRLCQLTHANRRQLPRLVVQRRKLVLLQDRLALRQRVAYLSRAEECDRVL